MRNFGKIALCSLGIWILSGCGHSVLLTNKMTGFALTLPVGEGQKIGLVIGATESTTATVRGGTTVESTSVSGAGLFSGTGGANQITTMKTNVQLNEGYLTDVLTSDKCPESVKLVLASNLVGGVQAPPITPSVAQTGQSSFHSGDTAVVSNNVPQIANQPTIVDSVVNGATEIVHEVTSGAVEITSDAASIVTNVTSNALVATTESAGGFMDRISKWIHDIKWSNFWMTLLLALMAYLGYKYVRAGTTKEKELPVLEETNPDCLDPKPVDPDHSLDEVVEPVEPEPTEKPKEESNEEKQDEQPCPWYKKIWLFLTFLWGLVMRIPPEKRAAIWKKIITVVKKK